MAEAIGKGLLVGIGIDARVTIEVVCNSDYEAEVLYEDIIDRLRRGEAISFSVAAQEPAKVGK